MIFSNNMLTSLIIFNILLDLTGDQYYPCMQKAQVFVLRLFWLLLIQQLLINQNF